MKIRKKIVIFFSIIMVAITLLVLSDAFYFTDQIILKNAEDKLQAVATIQKARVEELIKKDIEILKQITNRTGIQDALAGYVSNPNEQDLNSLTIRLDDVQASNSSFEVVAVYGVDGKLIASSAPEINIADFYDPHLEEELGEDKIEINTKKDEKLILHGPVNKNGKILGTLIILSKPDDFTSVTKDYVGLGDTGEVILAGRTDDGDAIYLSQPRFAESDDRTIVTKDKANVPITQAMNKNETLFDNLSDYRDHQVIAVTKYIPETDWGLVVKVDRAEIVKPFYTNAIGLAVLSIVAILITLVASFFMAKSISRPIEMLRTGAREIENGNLDYKVGLKNKDEIGELSNSFDQMTSSLKDSRENIEEKIKERTSELEKINKAMVGRELKMIELKKEIEKLKKEK